MVPSSLSASISSHAPWAPSALHRPPNGIGPLRHPAGPGWPSRVASRRALRRRSFGCCCCFPLSDMPSPIPGRTEPAPGRSLCLWRIGLRIACREACSAFTPSAAACTLAIPPTAVILHRVASVSGVTSSKSSGCHPLDQELRSGLRTGMGTPPFHGARELPVGVARGQGCPGVGSSPESGLEHGPRPR